MEEIGELSDILLFQDKSVNDLNKRETKQGGSHIEIRQ